MEIFTQLQTKRMAISQDRKFKENKKLIWDTEGKYILPTKSHEHTCQHS